MEIRLNNLNKSFDGRPVLKDVSYTFESGKLYVIKGVSGCGKTTLLNILGGVDTEYDGTCDTGGARTAMIFQKSLLLGGLTVRENLLLVRNDPQAIKRLAGQLGIAALLKKYPSEISGGERQRVSVARALLNAPGLLLADEPTASLDAENSERIAQILAGLKREDRIIIVATHEDCFDGFADAILPLDYGELAEPEEGTVTMQVKNAAEETELTLKRTRPISPVYFAVKRHPELLKLRALLPLTFAFLLLILTGIFRNSFAKEALRYYAKRYPVDLAGFTKEQYEKFSHKEWLTVYDYYEAEENGLTAYYLMPQEDSVLNVDGMLEAGHFPAEKDEVIITQETAEILFPGVSFADCVGRTFGFCGRTWTVSAVTIPQKATFNEHFRVDLYYMRVNKTAVFIPYETLKTFTEKKENPVYPGSLMCVVRGMAKDEEKRQAVEDALFVKIPGMEEGQKGWANLYLQKIDIRKDEIDQVMKVFYAVFFTMCLLICLYMVSVIRTELFYRRKELGYLQIFGLPKEAVLQMLWGEHLVRVIAAFILAAASALALSLLYGIILGGIVLPSWLTFPACLLFALLYLMFAYGTARKYLKTSIRELISY